MMATELSTSTGSRPPKRKAADESDSRLAKRFDLLNIENGSKRYIPVAAYTNDPHLGPRTADAQARAQAQSQPQISPQDDWMQVEDTKDKVYIYDLDAELAGIESDEETPVYMPDIERHLNRIPKHILVGSDKEDVEKAKASQLILYKEPISLTVPPEQDSVRKAIIEARARHREKQGQPKPNTPGFWSGNEWVDGVPKAEDSAIMEAEEDPDAMDMD